MSDYKLKPRTTLTGEIHYYKTEKQHYDYLGVRYFKVNYNSDSVVQVCINTGEPKRGKGQHIGVYMVSKEHLFANYVAYGRVVSCTKKEYQKAFMDIIKYIQP